MKLLRKIDIARLKKNFDLQKQAQTKGQTIDDNPVVKLFTPWSNATWLLTEIDEDGIAFGLCDLGMQSPEIGYLSISEINGIQGPAGLRVERDCFFTAGKTLSQYADAARQQGYIAA